MIPQRYSRYLLLFALAGSLFLISGCRGQAKTAPNESLKDGLMMVLPVKDMTKIYGSKSGVKSPLDGRFFLTGEVTKRAPAVVTEKLMRSLRKRGNLRLIPPETARGLISGEDGNCLDRRCMVGLGRSMGADLVMAGYMYRFRERVGNAYSVETPASVAFSLHIIETKNGGLVWSGHFDETQISLTDNLYTIGAFLERKGRWLTAEELGDFGLNDVLKTMGGL